MGKGFCKCGCGLEVNGNNSYIHGHNRRNLASYVIPKDKWSIKYDACVSCGTTEIKHVGRGLCSLCYKKDFYNKSKTKTKWSKEYEKCVDCGERSAPYKALGRCNNCYVKYLNRKKGVKERISGSWARDYDKCVMCGSVEAKHVKDGCCSNCYKEIKRGDKATETCPVCGVKVEKLYQHLSMKAKKCEEHRKYKYNMFKKYFYSNLSLYDISKELDGMDRHAITRNFILFFGLENTNKRNQDVKSNLCSKRVSIGFNCKNRFGTVVYYDSKNNGKVRFRSKLERRYAELLDINNIKWFYECKVFSYIDVNRKKRHYTPDFYLPEFDKFIEVKGYDNGQAEYKVNCLLNSGVNISILREKDIKNQKLI